MPPSRLRPFVLEHVFMYASSFNLNVTEQCVFMQDDMGD